MSEKWRTAENWNMKTIHNIYAAQPTNRSLPLLENEPCMIPYQKKTQYFEETVHQNELKVQL